MTVKHNISSFPYFLRSLTLLVGAFIFITSNTWAQEQDSLLRKATEILTKSERANHATYSVAIREVMNGTQQYDYSGSRLLCPASVTKLFTSAIALEVLGADYAFNTDLYINGKVDQKILNGSITVVTSGDPSIASKYFPRDSLRWVDNVYQALTAHQIAHIKGDIIIDASCFESVGVNPMWANEDKGEYYGAGVYGGNIYDNWVNLFYQTGKKANDYKVTGSYPPDVAVYWDNQLTVHCKKSGWGASGKGLEERRTIKGILPCNRAQVTVRTDLPNPPRYMGRWLKMKLLQFGITVEGNVQVSFTPSNQRERLIGRYYSPSLRQLCQVMNFRSLNHYAEALLKAIDRDPKGQRAATTNGAVAIAEQIWAEDGLTLSNNHKLFDGSGLARANRVSALDVVSLLNYMSMHTVENVDAFMNSLPQAGVEGTVKSFMRDSHLRLFVKSGSMRDIQCYAGYLHYQGRSYSVALLASNVTNRAKVRLAMQKYLETLFPKPTVTS